MTTGMTDFIIKSGFKTPIEQIPTPDFVAPYDEPKSKKIKLKNYLQKRQQMQHQYIQRNKQRDQQQLQPFLIFFILFYGN